MWWCENIFNTWFFSNSSCWFAGCQNKTRSFSNQDLIVFINSLPKLLGRYTETITSFESTLPSIGKSWEIPTVAKIWPTPKPGQWFCRRFWGSKVSHLHDLWAMLLRNFKKLFMASVGFSQPNRCRIPVCSAGMVVTRRVKSKELRRELASRHCSSTGDLKISTKTWGW